MVELIIVYNLAKSIGDKAEAKGRMRFGYQCLLWLFWFGGEFLGAFLGAFLSGATGAHEPNWVLVYGCGIAGAIVGAVLTFAIVNSLSSLKGDDDFRRYDYGYGRKLPDKLSSYHDFARDDVQDPAPCSSDDRYQR
jgi:MFS family permease